MTVPSIAPGVAVTSAAQPNRPATGEPPTRRTRDRLSRSIVPATGPSRSAIAVDTSSRAVASALPTRPEASCTSWSKASCTAPPLSDQAERLAQVDQCLRGGVRGGIGDEPLHRGGEEEAGLGQQRQRAGPAPTTSRSHDWPSTRASCSVTTSRSPGGASSPSGIVASIETKRSSCSGVAISQPSRSLTQTRMRSDRRRSSARVPVVTDEREAGVALDQQRAGRARWHGQDEAAEHSGRWREGCPARAGAPGRPGRPRRSAVMARPPAPCSPRRTTRSPSARRVLLAAR